MKSSDPQHNRMRYWPHFTDNQTKASGSGVACTRSHSESGFEYRLSGYKTCALSHSSVNRWEIFWNEELIYRGESTLQRLGGHLIQDPGEFFLGRRIFAFIFTFLLIRQLRVGRPKSLLHVLDSPFSGSWASCLPAWVLEQVAMVQRGSGWIKTGKLRSSIFVQNDILGETKRWGHIPLDKWEPSGVCFCPTESSTFPR